MKKESNVFSLEFIAVVFGGMAVLNPGDLLTPFIRLVLFIALFSVVVAFGWAKTFLERRKLSEVIVWTIIYLFFSGITFYSYSVKELNSQHQARIKQENLSKVEGIKEKGKSIVVDFFNKNKSSKEIIDASIKWRNESKMILVGIDYDLFLRFEMSLPKLDSKVTYAELRSELVGDYNLIVSEMLEISRIEKEFK